VETEAMGEEAAGGVAMGGDGAKTLGGQGRTRGVASDWGEGVWKGDCGAVALRRGLEGGVVPLNPLRRDGEVDCTPREGFRNSRMGLGGGQSNGTWSSEARRLEECSECSSWPVQVEGPVSEEIMLSRVLHLLRVGLLAESSVGLSSRAATAAVATGWIRVGPSGLRAEPSVSI
jgi:hypothetical protein